ncbi:MAG: hypothetical protein AABZ40_04765, partial [Thermodesulfobacteriota bacterium]
MQQEEQDHDKKKFCRFELARGQGHIDQYRRKRGALGRAIPEFIMMNPEDEQTQSDKKDEET